jgi:phage/plasmid-like protein (TIGR03299 family)
MAHELTIRQDGFTEMAFVGETPWHGLGQELQEGASIEQWQKSAGMDWEILKSPVIYEAHGAPFEMPNRTVLVRSDNAKALSVVSDRYKPVQPVEVLEFFRDLVEENGFKLHTAGTLFGGKRMWALAETGQFAEIGKDDGIGGFLLLSTSCDKSLATTARFTSVRVVCNNTLSMATAEDACSVSFTHARDFDYEAMKAKLGKAVESFGAFIEMGRVMQKQKLAWADASDFVRQLVLTKEQLLDNEYNYDKHRGYAKIMDLFEGEAMGSDLAGNTRWGLLNAVTEYLDHHHPARNDDARLNHTWFGGGDKMKARAIQLLTA